MMIVRVFVRLMELKSHKYTWHTAIDLYLFVLSLSPLSSHVFLENVLCRVGIIVRYLGVPRNLQLTTSLGYFLNVT